ncbi:superoxide dismutase family protein [Paenibacillus allorhizosphaerae]|uniref:Superoxide dismutase [Cu-Zn] n=1 Tax=Paenibacillus allorhizosphaerae TaxID=2849866 RepID=A0ABM8VEM5_9BACL|nr:superoxide dismutase family protein [Paenibacillus allorhizosphaerae]CAG7629404.1 hypothetical protein PAECIP111802_01551 [Paenibacillus allorhizosphaerae]
MKLRLVKVALIAAFVLVLSACQGQPFSWFGSGANKQAKQAGPDAHAVSAHPDGHAAASSEGTASPVTVDLIGLKGTSIGKAKLTPVDGGVQFDVEAAYLPRGEHGIHVHENGKCEAPKFESAGVHFNPQHKKHGELNPEGPHAGDLPNLMVAADGKAQASFVSKMVTLEKDKPNSLLKPGGTALVIHEKADDYKTDPSGNSGARIACGVIQ